MDARAVVWERPHGAPRPEPGPSGRYAIYPVSSAEIMELAAYDRPRWGANRLPALAAPTAERPHQCFVAVDRETKAFAGFALGAPERIGPIMADAPEAAAWLLFACERAGAPARVLACEENSLVRGVLTAAGYLDSGAAHSVEIPSEAHIASLYAV